VIRLALAVGGRGLADLRWDQVEHRLFLGELVDAVLERLQLGDLLEQLAQVGVAVLQQLEAVKWLLPSTPNQVKQVLLLISTRPLAPSA
jgi:RNA-binding protein YlmH